MRPRLRSRNRSGKPLGCRAIILRSDARGDAYSVLYVGAMHAILLCDCVEALARAEHGDRVFQPGATPRKNWLTDPRVGSPTTSATWYAGRLINLA